MKFNLPFMSPASILEAQQEVDFTARLRVIRRPPKVSATGILESDSWEIWDGTKVVQSGFESIVDAAHWIKEGNYYVTS